MRRHLEPVDLMVAVGVLATVIAGYLFFLAADGALRGASTARAEVQPVETGPAAAMQWVQPALGHAIVQTIRTDQIQDERLRQAVNELNRAVMSATYADDAVSIATANVREAASILDGDHAGRVQYVLGRGIVLETVRGTRAHLLTADQPESPYNMALIARMEARGRDMTQRYASRRESMMGRAIVTATAEAVRAMSASQERLGTAIGNVILAQDAAEQMKGAAQRQLALVAIASLHGDEIADRFMALSEAERSLEAAPSFAEAKTWPETHVGWLTAGTIGLVTMFVMGLMIPLGRPEPTTTVKEPVIEYRKSA